MVGINKLPKVLRVTKIPTAIDINDKQKINLMIEQGKLDEYKIKTEYSESKAIDVIEKYFDLHSNEDVFIMTNQDLRDPTNNTWHERDIFIINLSRGYILNMEVKSVFNNKKSNDNSKPVHIQLQKTYEILINQFDNPQNLQQEWKLIKLVYATKVDQKSTICNSVKEFIITENDDFNFKLSLILDTHAPEVNSYSYVEDFYTIVREVLPERVRICDEIVKTFQPANEVILGKVTEVVEKRAGSVETISFWSGDQIDIVSECKNLKRVLFDSAFSTGKTLIMMECIRQLVETDKVLFIIRTGTKIPILLNFKIQGIFQKHKGEKNLEIKQCDFENEDEVNKIITEHPDHHIFIDELVFGRGSVTLDSIVQWSELVKQHKHFWMIICYGKGKKTFDIEKLRNYFHIPSLKYPLRNPKEIVELVKDKMNGLGSGYTEMFSGDCISQLEVPEGLTHTFKPCQIVASNYSEAFKNVFDDLDKVLCDFIPILFLFVDSERNKMFKCQCYSATELSLNLLQTRNYINAIFEQNIKRKECSYIANIFLIVIFDLNVVVHDKFYAQYDIK